MTTMGLIFDNSIGIADLVVDALGALSAGDPLVTSSFVSLFTRRLATTPTGDDLPSVPAGWWGDTFTEEPLGSRLWTLIGEKNTLENRRLAQVFTLEAHAWWQRDGVVKELSVVVERRDIDGMNIAINARRPDGSRWAHVWEVNLVDL